VAFYVVYIKEAHPSNAWQMASNIRDNVIFADPATNEERSAIAGTCVRRLGLEIPALMDDLQNSTEAAYTGWPDRLYVIGADGRVVFKSSAGPFGFDPHGVELALQQLGLTRNYSYNEKDREVRMAIAQMR
jgi:type I thyroxine 5'-deiodinase